MINYSMILLQSHDITLTYFEKQNKSHMTSKIV